MKKIYLAGSCASECRTDMVAIAQILRYLNYEVYCPFELKIEDAWSMSQELWAEKVFNADLEAIDNCDIFFMVSPGRESSAGTNWEQGYAYAKGKKVMVAQYTENPTSLMTYCGSTYFYNYSSMKKLREDIWWILSEDSCIAPRRQESCKTVLT